MTKQEWFEYYVSHRDKFWWFIKLVPGAEKQLEIGRSSLNLYNMLSILNQVWYELPDHQFNIIENPPGWKEFLYLLEDEVTP